MTIAFEMSGAVADGDDVAILRHQIVATQAFARLGCQLPPCLQLPERGEIEVNHFPPPVIAGAVKGEQGVNSSGGNTPLLHPGYRRYPSCGT